MSGSNMLVKLGRQTAKTQTLEQRLLDCHARIRNFCAIARRLAQAPEANEASEAAIALQRYFRIALPLHIADEEESIAPRLMHLGDRTIDAAVDAMVQDHVRTDVRLDELLYYWHEIAEQPTPARCLATRTLAAEVAVHFSQHLDAEEKRLFPSLARLPGAQVNAIVAEMRSRRGG